MNYGHLIFNLNAFSFFFFHCILSRWRISVTHIIHSLLSAQVIQCFRFRTCSIIKFSHSINLCVQHTHTGTCTHARISRAIWATALVCCLLDVDDSILCRCLCVRACWSVYIPPLLNKLTHKLPHTYTHTHTHYAALCTPHSASTVQLKHTRIK